MSPERIVAAIAGFVLLRATLLAGRASIRRLGTPIDVLPAFLLVWGVVLVLFAIPVIDYSATPLVAWIVLYGALVTTALGCLAAQLLGPADGASVSVSDADQALRDRIHSGRVRALWLASTVVGLVGFAAFVYAVDQVLSWSAVIDDGEAVRRVKRDSAVFQDSYGNWKILTNFNQVAFILWTIGLRIRTFSGPWRWARAFGLVSVVPFVFTADRGLLVALIAWAALVHVLWPAQWSGRKLAAVGMLVLVVAGVGLTAIGNRYGGSLDDHPEVAAHAASGLEPVVIPYLYLTGNIPAFGQLTQDGLAPVSYGQMSVLPLVKAAHAGGVPGTAPIATGVFYPIPFESFSNYSWLGTFWLDFRAIGVLLLAALSGLLASYARRRLAQAPSVASIWAASLLLYVIVVSPFANAWTATLVWQYLLLTPVVALALDKRVYERWSNRLRTPARRALAAGASAIALVALGVLLVRGPIEKPSDIDVLAELDLAVRKARYVYSEEGRYPQPLGLTTRLQVNRPELTFRAQETYSEALPAPPAIAIYSRPNDVFIRARARDGRVFEAHRTESFGGVTFGPGSRD